MGSIGKSLSLFLVLVLTLSSTATLVSGLTFVYGGASSATVSPPLIEFTVENATVMYNLGTFNIGLFAYIGFPENLQTLMAALYSVSYKASWQNQSTVIYQWSINDPANLNDDDPNAEQAFFYAIDLTHVPEGRQQIEVTVVGGGYLFGGNKYYTFSTSVSSSLYFTINAPPSPEALLSPHSKSTWNVQTIDANGAGGYTTNDPIVVLDSNNIPHIAYTKLPNNTISSATFVTYASWNESGWSTQTIAAGSAESLVLDANNTPHLLYQGWTGLTYATLTGSRWAFQTVDKNIGFSFGAVALDSSGKPHVAYTDGKTVKYASQTGSNWNIQTIDTIDPLYDVPFQISLAFDQNNVAYVMYGYPSDYQDKIRAIKYTTEIIKLAIEKNSSWNIETVTLPSPIDGYGNLVLDSKGFPHFICSQKTLPETHPTVNSLLYASWNGAKWITQTVVSNVSLKIHSSNVNWVNMGFLALDSHDDPHISYVTLTNPGYGDNMNLLTYASWTGNSWDIQTVDTNTPPSKPGFLALDSNNHPHISYLGQLSTFGYLQYASADVMYVTGIGTTRTVEHTALLLSVVIAVVVVLTVTAVSILLYRRHRKTA